MMEIGRMVLRKEKELILKFIANLDEDN